LKHSLLVLAVIGSIVAASPANAQVMGMNLDRHAAEIGFIYKWYHRDLEPNPPAEAKWGVSTFYVRYGAVPWMTGSLEGRVSEYENDEFEGMHFRRYTLGGGATVRLYRYGAWEFAGSFHFNEVWDEDRSEYHFHKRTYGVIAGLQAGRRFEIGGQRLGVWAGPMYARDVGENYPWDAEEPLRSESQDNLAIAAGGEIVAIGFLTGSAYVVWADYLQARLSFGVHVGGKR
jgi:hypothetical protein